MKIFISWSGEQSKQAALILKTWLENLFETVDAFMSSHDIEAGGRWGPRLNTELEGCLFGIICLTPENLKSEWVNFEAGALSKQVSDSHVVPLLFNLKETDFSGPLSQFQAVPANKEGLKRLVASINSSIEKPRHSEKLTKNFEMWWPELDKDFKNLPSTQKLKSEERPERELIEEILSLIRNQTRAAEPDVEADTSISKTSKNSFPVEFNGQSFSMKYKEYPQEKSYGWRLEPTAIGTSFTGLKSMLVRYTTSSAFSIVRIEGSTMYTQEILKYFIEYLRDNQQYPFDSP